MNVKIDTWRSRACVFASLFRLAQSRVISRYLAHNYLNYSRVLETAFSRRFARAHAYKPQPFMAILAIILRCLWHNEGEFFNVVEPSRARAPQQPVVAVAHRQFQFSRCSLWNGHHGTPTIRHEIARSLFAFFADPAFPPPPPPSAIEE